MPYQATRPLPDLLAVLNIGHHNTRCWDVCTSYGTSYDTCIGWTVVCCSELLACSWEGGA